MLWAFSPLIAFINSSWPLWNTPGPHVLSTTVPRTAEMGAQWDLSSLCVQVGFLLLSFLYPSPMQGLLHWVNSALAFLLSRTEQTIIYVYAWIHEILFFTPAGSAYEVSLLLDLDMKYVSFPQEQKCSIFSTDILLHINFIWDFYTRQLQRKQVFIRFHSP